VRIEDGTELEIVGVVRAKTLLAAPLTGEPCVIHVTHARVWDRLDHLGSLVEDVLVAGQVPFLVVTPEGAIWVDAEHAHIDLPAHELVPPHGERVLAFLAPRGLERYLRSTFADHVLLVPGTRIRIRGTAVRERAYEAGERGYRDEAVQLRLVGYRQRPIEIGVPVEPAL
jgi:hypothetical protein